jgi:hypothetical protein
MQSTIYFLQQQLKEAKETIANLQQQQQQKQQQHLQQVQHKPDEAVIVEPPKEVDLPVQMDVPDQVFIFYF